MKKKQMKNNKARRTPPRSARVTIVTPTENTSSHIKLYTFLAIALVIAVAVFIIKSQGSSSSTSGSNGGSTGPQGAVDNNATHLLKQETDKQQKQKKMISSLLFLCSSAIFLASFFYWWKRGRVSNMVFSGFLVVLQAVLFLAASIMAVDMDSKTRTGFIVFSACWTAFGLLVLAYGEQAEGKKMFKAAKAIEVDNKAKQEEQDAENKRIQRDQELLDMV